METNQFFNGSMALQQDILDLPVRFMLVWEPGKCMLYLHVSGLSTGKCCHQRKLCEAFSKQLKQLPNCRVSQKCCLICQQERIAGDAKRYSDIIRHETLRVAVCDMLEGITPCPDSLR